MLRRLAVLQKRPVESREFAANREADSFHPALLRCSLHACRLGLTSEATHLLEQSSPRRYDYWALRDYWHTSYILPWLLTIAVKIVVENKSLTLFDCLPLELWQLVQDEPVPETEEAQKKLLLAKLREEPTDEQRKTEKNTKVKLGASEKYHAPDTVSTRIVPTVRLAERNAALLSARSASNRHSAAIEYFDAWRAAQDSSERGIHSSRELGRFINDLYVTGALRVFGTIGLVNAETALRLEECLNNCEFVSAHDRIRFVGMLSAYPDCHVHAGRMGVEAVKAIEREDEITQRAGLLADLARGILPADRSEAAILFKHGLTELDAIGSGDWQFTNKLLSFAASLRDRSLKPLTALRLAKVCELNNYDSRKFPWPLAARAFSRAWGLGYLAQIARWHDRDKTDLDLTLPASLTFLIRDRLISPADGVALLGLVEPVEMWDWGWHDFFESLIETTDDTSLFEDVLNQMERAHPHAPYGRYLGKAREILERVPVLFASLKHRFELLEANAANRRTVDRNNISSHTPVEATELIVREEGGKQDVLLIVDETDPRSAAALETLVERIESVDGALDSKTGAFEKLRSRVAYGDRNKHIEAIIETRNLELFSKIALLQSAKDAWLADSPTGLGMSTGVGERLIRAHADELMASTWGFNWELNKLADCTGESRIELAISLVGEATLTKGAWGCRNNVDEPREYYFAASGRGSSSPCVGTAHGQWCGTSRG
jgi:hypothetical protein